MNLSQCCLRGAEAGRAIGDMLFANTSLQTLDLSGYGPHHKSSSDREFVKEFAFGLAANGALTSLNLSNNHIGESALPSGWEYSGRSLTNKQPIYINLSEHKVHYGFPGKPEGIDALKDAIKMNTTLTNLHIGNNGFDRVENFQDILNAVKSSNIQLFCGVPFREDEVTQLDVSGKNLGIEGAYVISDYLGFGGNENLLELNICDNGIGDVVLPSGHIQLQSTEGWTVYRSHCGTWEDRENPGQTLGATRFAIAVNNHTSLQTVKMGGQNGLITSKAGRAFSKIIEDSSLEYNEDNALWNVWKNLTRLDFQLLAILPPAILSLPGSSTAVSLNIIRQ